ncbi:MAG: fibrillarin-like rRNA/tRNA 2'-O-methyltransferase [Candidatus Parvarchaeota archaeon]
MFAAEFAPVPFIKLTSLYGIKDKMLSIISDPQKPDVYVLFADSIYIVYQDASQPNQVEIFTKSTDFFGEQREILMLKTFL